MTTLVPQYLPIDVALEQAVAYHRSSQLQDAERLYRAILQASPNHPDANHNLGVLAVQVKQPAAGLPHFKTALKANPKQRQYWLSNIDALIQAGQIDAARKVLEQGRQCGLQGEAVEALAGKLGHLEKPYSDQPAELERAIAHREAGRYKEAALVLQSWLASHPQDASAHALLAQVLSLDKQDEPAWAAMNIALSIDPALPIVQRNHARLLLKQQKPVEALQAAQAAYQSDASEAENQLVLAAALGAIGQNEQAFPLVASALQSQPDYAEAFATRAFLKLRGNDPAGALADAEKALSIKPHLVQLWGMVGSLRHQFNDLPGCVDALEKALEHAPDNAGTWSNLGAALQACGRIPEAKDAYAKALCLAPDLADVASNLGTLLMEEANWAEALRYFDQALAIKPDFAEAHNNLGAAFKNLRRLDEAAASYRRALQIKPDYAEAHNNLGNVLRDLGQLDAAETCYRRALELKPDYAEAHNNLGAISKNLGRLDEAEASFRLALQIMPGLAAAHNNLGNLFQTLGRLDEAQVCYARALQIKPDFAEAHNNLGSALADMGRPDEAEVCYRRALAVRPDYAGAHNNLGVALQELGRIHEAEASFRLALEIKPNFTEAILNLGHILCNLDDLRQAAAAYEQVVAIDPADNGLAAAANLAILHFLDRNLEKCRSNLSLSQSITAMTDSKHKNSRTYWSLLDRLLIWHQQARQEYMPGMESLHVIGESHSLSAHGVLVHYNGKTMTCAAEWIVGCKQWHLGNNKANKFKHKFEAVMARLPRGSTILLSIGEIDCRHDEGILKACRKYPDKTLNEIVRSTVEAYLNYVAGIAGRYEHRLIVSGVPCTNISLDALKPAEVEQLVQVIRVANETLKDLAIASGMDFLDVHALTDRGDGVASGQWHIDGHHLLPSAVAEAFDRYCVLQ